MERQKVGDLSLLLCFAFHSCLFFLSFFVSSFFSSYFFLFSCQLCPHLSYSFSCLYFNLHSTETHTLLFILYFFITLGDKTSVCLCVVCFLSRDVSWFAFPSSDRLFICLVSSFSTNKRTREPEEKSICAFGARLH